MPSKRSNSTRIDSAMNASLQTDVIYPDSSDTTSAGADQVKFTFDQLGRKVTSTDQRRRA